MAEFRPIFGGKKNITKSLDDIIFELLVELSALKRRYKATLQKELTVAQVNKRKNIKSTKNYSKIGVAYYSLLVIDGAEKRINDISSTRELSVCMNSLAGVLSTINRLGNKIEKPKTRTMISEAENLGKGSEGEEKELAKMLGSMKDMSIGSSKEKLDINSLVSVDIIERLINDDPLEDVFEDSDEATMSIDKMFASINDNINSDENTVSDDMDLDLSDLKDIFAGL